MEEEALPARAVIRDLARRFRALALVVTAGAALLLSIPALSQTGVAGEVFVNSEVERYLRVLQVAGEVPLYPWSIRSFSRSEIDRLSPLTIDHPWADRYRLTPPAGRGELSLLRPEVRAVFNSAFPLGTNDGAVWAGRGPTVAVRAGFHARYGPLSLTVAPTGFWAQNASFKTQDTGFDGPLAFADPRNPTAIDAPQRFGDGPYARFDAGQSTLRIDASGVSAGVSTANQSWGPAVEYPLLLGNNAPGFLHGWLGTARPLKLWLAKLHGRLVWGRLEESDFTLNDGLDRLRFASGLVAVITPRGVDGLELGVSRFFHLPWREGGPNYQDFLRPLEGIFKQDLDRDGEENQLASAFARWVFPRDGLEVWGEFAREDHSLNLRDFILEPDHNSGFTVGVQKVWRFRPSRYAVWRAELINAQTTHLAKVRGQTPFYRHSELRQGHTHRGQILGSPTGYGGTGGTVALDLYHTAGRWSAFWRRSVREDRRAVETRPAGGERSEAIDVLHEGGVEVVRFLGRLEVQGAFGVGWNVRHGSEDDDRWNVHAALSFRAKLGK